MADTTIPRAALGLGLAGLIPFLAGAALALFVRPGATGSDASAFFAPGDGVAILVAYGAVILSFMSGVLWGFATRAEPDRAALFYTLSVIPALWVFFTATQHVFFASALGSMGLNLIAGFIGLLGLDWLFWRQGLAPPWWMRLRVLLTSVVVLCLLVAVV